MNRERLRFHRLLNGVQTALLLAAAGALVGGLAWQLGGRGPALVACGMLLLAYWSAPRISPAIVLRAFHARPLDPGAVPELQRVVTELARRAGLPAAPVLYYVPSDVLNAFAVGHPRRSAIALSDGLLRRLGPRELAGVLAHEIAHLANGDLRLLGFADLASRATGTLSQIGLLLALLNLPLVLVGARAVSWWTILLLLYAPTLSTLVQLALSRTREHDADAEAARLLGDPRPLISALHRIEQWRGRLLRELLVPGTQRLPDPSWLRTHPATAERQRRLLELAPGHPPSRDPWRPAEASVAPPLGPEPLRARWHRTGLWY